VAGLLGEALEHRHRGGGQRLELAVDDDGVAADLQPVPAGHQPGDAVLGQVPGEQAGERAEPGAVGLDHRDAAGDQRPRGDRAHAGAHHPGGERLHQRLLQALGAGRVEHREHGRGAGEGDRVDRAGDRLADQAAQRRGVAVGQPAVHRHLDHLGARVAQRGDELGERLAVQLHRDAPPGDVLGEEVVLHLLAGLRLGGPVVVEPGRPDRAARLGAAGEHPGLAEVLGELGAEAPALGRGHPAAEAHPGGDHHVVDGRGEARPGGGEQVGVLRQRHQPDGGGADHAGAAPFQQGGELLPPPGRGHPDGEPGERVGRGFRRGLRHGEGRRRGSRRRPLQQRGHRASLPRSRVRAARGPPAGAGRGRAGSPGAGRTSPCLQCVMATPSGWDPGRPARGRPSPVPSMSSWACRARRERRAPGRGPHRPTSTTPSFRRIA